MEEEYIILSGWEVVYLPFRYLGVHIHCCKLKNGERKPLVDHFKNKLSN
jgi:hypothetical protein